MFEMSQRLLCLRVGGNIGCKDRSTSWDLVGFPTAFIVGLGQYYISSMYGHHHIYEVCSKSMDQPGKVVNPARGQLNREN